MKSWSSLDVRNRNKILLVFQAHFERVIRDAIASDLDSVRTIRYNVYGGTDSLSNLYNQWLSEKMRANRVFLKSGEIVGFSSISWYRKENSTVFVGQALRVKTDLAGKNFVSFAVSKAMEFMRKYENPVLIRQGFFCL